MNLAHPALPRGLGLPGHQHPFSMASSYSNPASLQQRSPFAIQELLGLNNQDSISRPTPHNPHADPVISAAAAAAASAYIPRSLAPIVNHQTSSLSDQAAFTSWRHNFMSQFSGAAVHSAAAQQNMLHNLTSPPHHSHMSPNSHDSGSGKHMGCFPLFNSIQFIRLFQT